MMRVAATRWSVKSAAPVVRRTMLAPHAVRGAATRYASTAAVASRVATVRVAPRATWTMSTTGTATAGASLFLAAALWATPAQCANVYELGDADMMWEHPERYTRKEVFSYLQKMNEAESGNPAVQWRLARAYYDLACEPDVPQKEAHELMKQAHSLIHRALEGNTNDSDIHRWCGTILNGLSNYLSTKESIANSYRIREHWEDAIEVNPHDATAKHLLGRWSFEVASLSWLKRKLARALFAAPPQSSYDEALRYFEDAERERPGFWKMNQVMLAKCEQKLGHNDKAVEWAQKAIKLPTVSNDDKEAHTEAEAFLKKYGPK